LRPLPRLTPSYSLSAFWTNIGCIADQIVAAPLTTISPFSQIAEPRASYEADFQKQQERKRHPERQAVIANGKDVAGRVNLGGAIEVG
jgi:hypothetical protein